MLGRVTENGIITSGKSGWYLIPNNPDIKTSHEIDVTRISRASIPKESSQAYILVDPLFDKMWWFPTTDVFERLVKNGDRYLGDIRIDFMISRHMYSLCRACGKAQSANKLAAMHYKDKNEQCWKHICSILDLDEISDNNLNTNRPGRRTSHPNNQPSPAVYQQPTTTDIQHHQQQQQQAIMLLYNQAATGGYAAPSMRQQVTHSRLLGGILTPPPINSLSYHQHQQVQSVPLQPSSVYQMFKPASGVGMSYPGNLPHVSSGAFGVDYHHSLHGNNSSIQHDILNPNSIQHVHDALINVNNANVSFNQLNNHSHTMKNNSNNISLVAQTRVSTNFCQQPFITTTINNNNNNTYNDGSYFEHNNVNNNHCDYVSIDDEDEDMSNHSNSLPSQQQQNHPPEKNFIQKLSNHMPSDHTDDKLASLNLSSLPPNVSSPSILPANCLNNDALASAVLAPNAHSILFNLALNAEEATNQFLSFVTNPFEARPSKIDNPSLENTASAIRIIDVSPHVFVTGVIPPTSMQNLSPAASANLTTFFFKIDLLQDRLISMMIELVTAAISTRNPYPFLLPVLVDWGDGILTEALPCVSPSAVSTGAKDPFALVLAHLQSGHSFLPLRCMIPLRTNSSPPVFVRLPIANTFPSPLYSEVLLPLASFAVSPGELLISKRKTSPSLSCNNHLGKPTYGNNTLKINNGDNGLVNVGGVVASPTVISPPITNSNNLLAIPPPTNNGNGIISLPSLHTSPRPSSLASSLSSFPYSSPHQVRSPPQGLEEEDLIELDCGDNCEPYHSNRSFALKNRRKHFQNAVSNLVLAYEACTKDIHGSTMISDQISEGISRKISIIKEDYSLNSAGSNVDKTFNDVHSDCKHNVNNDEKNSAANNSIIRNSGMKPYSTPNRIRNLNKYMNSIIDSSVNNTSMKTTDIILSEENFVSSLSMNNNNNMKSCNSVTKSQIFSPSISSEKLDSKFIANSKDVLVSRPALPSSNSVSNSVSKQFDGSQVFNSMCISLPQLNVLPPPTPPPPANLQFSSLPHSFNLNKASEPSLSLASSMHNCNETTSSSPPLTMNMNNEANSLFEISSSQGNNCHTQLASLNRIHASCLPQLRQPESSLFIQKQSSQACSNKNSLHQNLINSIGSMHNINNSNNNNNKINVESQINMERQQTDVSSLSLSTSADLQETSCVAYSTTFPQQSISFESNHKSTSSLFDLQLNDFKKNHFSDDGGHTTLSNLFSFSPSRSELHAMANHYRDDNRLEVTLDSNANGILSFSNHNGDDIDDGLRLC